MRKREFEQKWLLLLVAFVTMLLISACQSSESSETDNAGSGTDSTEDGGGNGDTTEISISMRTLGFIHVENHPDINDDPYVHQLEEITNTDLDIIPVPHGEFEQKMDLMYASGDIPDVVATSGAYGGGQSTRDAVEAGVFLPLDELLEEHGQNLLEQVPQAAWDAVTYEDGVVYAIPEFLANPSRRATIVRKDLLEEADIPLPTTAEEAWTVEETLDVLRTFKDMGIEQPYAGRAEFKYSDTFFGAYDAFAYDSQMVEVDGQVQPKFFNEENMTNAIQTYKTMYDEGLIHPEFLTHEYNDYKNAGLSGKAAMWSMNANELLQWQGQLEESVPEGELAIIPSPRGTDGEGGHYLYGSVPRSYMINSDAEDKAVEIVKFLDWMLSEEAETFFSYGIEGEDYEMNNDEVDYFSPETNDEINAERFRTGWLWLVKDTTYYENLLELTEEGKELMNVYDTVLANEGRDGIRYIPGLTALDSTPNLAAKSDVPSQFVMENIAKMVTGAEPIDNWGNVVEEWKERGGEKQVEEATERYNNDDYLEPRR